MDDLPALLLLTYRPDEIGREHPLQGVLGGLRGRNVQRLPLGTLSPDGVAELATGSAVDVRRLHRVSALRCQVNRSLATAATAAVHRSPAEGSVPGCRYPIQGCPGQMLAWSGGTSAGSSGAAPGPSPVASQARSRV
jgi:hypothetical protein